MLTLSGDYEYQSDFARHHRSEGRAQGEREGHDEGRLEAARDLACIVAERLGALTFEQAADVAACADLDLLRRTVVELADAADQAWVADLLRRLRAAPPSPPAPLPARKLGPPGILGLLVRRYPSTAAAAAEHPQLADWQEHDRRFADRYFEDGRAAGREEARTRARLAETRAIVALLVERHGRLADATHQRLAACDGHAHLYALAAAITSAGDLAAVERMLGRLLPPIA